MKVIGRTLLCLVICVVIGCSDAIMPEPEKIVAPQLNRESAGVALAHGSDQREQDRSGFIQLLFDGTLRVDLIGEFPPRLHIATVSDAELIAIRALAEAPELIAYLSGDEWDPDECVFHIPEDHRVIHLRIDAQSLARNPWCSALARDLASELKTLEAKYTRGE
jgi:hypothetical protein